MRTLTICQQLHILCQRIERTTLILKHLEKQEQRIIS